MPDGISVSVVVLTYNHEKYIRQCLDSVLMQKTDFTFEILIGEDCSTDDTALIVAEYVKTNPDIMTAFFSERNKGATKNGYDTLSQTKGDYVAFIEGDDYWTSPLKLQKQFDFLENNKSFSSCYTRSMWIDQYNKQIPQSENYISKGVYTFDDFDGYHFVGDTCTIFYRNFFLDKSHDYTGTYKCHNLIGDLAILLITLTRGNSICLDEVMAVRRRIVDANAHNATSIQYRHPHMHYEFYKYYLKLENYMRREFGKKIYIARREWLFSAHVTKCLQNLSIDGLKYTFIMITKSKKPLKYTLVFFKELFMYPKMMTKKIKERWHRKLQNDLLDTRRRVILCQQQLERLRAENAAIQSKLDKLINCKNGE